MKLRFFPWISHEIWCFTKIFLWTWQLHQENPRTSSFFHILSIQKNTFSLNPWKVQVHHAFSWRTYMFSCVGCEIWMSSLIFFRKLKCYLEISNKELCFNFQGNGPSCDQPDKRSFFHKPKGLWQCQPPHFWFHGFFISKLLLRASPYPRVAGQGFSGQRSRVRAQCSEKILFVFGMLPTPISKNHEVSCDQPSRGWDFLPSEEAAVMSDLKLQQSQKHRNS